MDCKILARKMARLCLFAWMSSGVLLSQDALTPTQHGLHLVNQGRYREAEAYFLQALEIAGPANATAVYNLASLYQRQGRLKAAERLHRLSLEQIERVHGSHSLEMAQSLNDLGALFRSQGKYSRAVGLLETAVRILDRNAPQTLACSVFNNLGNTYFEVGKHGEASTYIDRAVALAESGKCEDRSDLGYTLNSLGRIHLQRKEFNKAEAVFQRAASTFADTLGPQHPDYALALANLAGEYQRQRRFAEALLLLELAVGILECSFGPEAPMLATTLHTCGEVMKAVGRKSEAKLILLRAKSIASPASGTVDIAALNSNRQVTGSRKQGGR